MKYVKIGFLILIFVMCFIFGGILLAGASFFLMFAVFQFLHVWNRQSYVISFKDFIAPILNLLVGIVYLVGAIGAILL